MIVGPCVIMIFMVGSKMLITWYDSNIKEIMSKFR
jgi:hypothetical protein